MTQGMTQEKKDSFEVDWKFNAEDLIFGEKQRILDNASL